MRLLNTKTHKIQSFTSSPNSLPKYAILSHTWGSSSSSSTSTSKDAEEATFAQWESRLTRARKSREPGFAKILKTCRRARQDELEWAWIDTVCIDRSSSAELSEAINSMFNWYQRAQVCYVYLEDVPAKPRDGKDVLEMFILSRWFKRGWTLQELLAPDHVLFFSSDWIVLGTKKALAATISAATGIESQCLCKETRLRQYSVAQRMSWAADRHTTREEDIAYSLMGIFNISMPLLYGEGSKAFARLQEEIIKSSNDHSIFAFDTLASQNSLLADHPSLFRSCSRIQPRFEHNMTPPFQLTNAGLALSTPLIHTLSPYWFLAVLNCFEVDSGDGRRLLQICLPLLGKDNTFMRAREPVVLVRRALRSSRTPLQYEIQDLTTSVVSSYMVTYFTRVYPAFGAELDGVMKGFQDDDVHKSGFLLTFPRGMGRYRVVESYPAGALQEDTGLFNPAADSEAVSYSSTSQPYVVLQQLSHGLIIFEETPPSPPSSNLSCSDTNISNATTVGGGPAEPTNVKPQRIGVYLAQADALVRSRWMCKLVPDPPSDFLKRYNNEWINIASAVSEVEAAGDAQTEVEADADGEGHDQWPYKPDPDTWDYSDQYDYIRHFIVAARTQLVYSSRPRQVVLVEIVFDALDLLQDISASSTTPNALFMVEMKRHAAPDTFL
ncbi:HET-domain-containing protein [Xylariaceae sp. FL0255]|nr:HET-domain-containing protein [Xylariaceae sp. FL0255]